MSNVPRITPQVARPKVRNRSALLVCAYDSAEKFATFCLEGAISLADFRAREATIPKDTELIFYCA